MDKVSQYCGYSTITFFVGIQTLFVCKEAERLQEFSIGDFTRDWVDFNCNSDSEVYTDSFRSPIIVTYGISRFWASFRFQEPSAEEMSKHWQDNFSLNMKPFIQIFSLCDKQKLCCLCTCVSHTVSLVWLWLWAPNQLDMGHGFKLVRFFKLTNQSSIL